MVYHVHDSHYIYDHIPPINIEEKKGQRRSHQMADKSGKEVPDTRINIDDSIAHNYVDQQYQYLGLLLMMLLTNDRY
jgi:hypothetical protein